MALPQLYVTNDEVTFALSITLDFGKHFVRLLSVNATP